MSDLPPVLWLIPALPLLAAALTALLGPRLLRQQSHWPCVIAAVLSCAVSFFVFSKVWEAERHGEDGEARPVEIKEYYRWLKVQQPMAAAEQARPPDTDVGITLRADPLAAVMLVTVTFVGMLIVIFSIGYMHGDPGYPRFFAEVALFLASMTTLVLADNFVLLYVGWEGVGLCSYLLIGFWFAKPSAADAARKAFLVTRLGDVGLFLGILVLWWGSGYHLDYEGVFRNIDPGHLTVACLLLFCGAVGKSAQFPLHVWLPDAMEGPTPVSALIHAATMVTAGVYLVARCTPLFAGAPDAQFVVGCIGGFTALLAALIALTQNDLKRVLAYSTISQLGYMFLALGSATGTRELATLAVIAAIFHLVTHAFFKALLFLSSGSVMHAMGGVIDMRRLGGLRRLMPCTHAAFLCGAAALAGIPLLSGFWSKDEILAAALDASHAGPHAAVYLLLFLAGLVTAGLTAFYTFRAYFMTFWGPERVPEEAGRHAHESPAVMTLPLVVLAVGAVLLGILIGPTHRFAHFLAWTPGLTPEVPSEHNWVVMIGGSLFALGGVALAWLMYAKQPDLPGRLARAAQGLYQASLNKFYLDELYDLFFVSSLNGAAEFLRLLDTYLVDGLVDLIGQVPRLLGALFRPIQNGLVQFYALAMVLGVAVFLIAWFLRW